MASTPATTARLLIVGPQGSGKGTQGIRIAEALGIPVVSTGDIFRANIKEGTELGRQVTEILDRGDLVPDELTGAIVRDRLQQADAARGFLLDGYPRNAAQVSDLDAFLAESDAALDAVILLDVAREESIARLSLRAVEQGRSDDNEEAIAKRLDIYEKETAPILEVYGARGIVDRIDGAGDLDEITERILAALEARGLAPAAAV
ncbi:adenylate kinase [Microbacterium keratanolyticum]|uniref:Adenylate kinase n=1 Tax=Microbacterium keratanolyticum TaxID=67574 RepID=A0A9W6HS46_9MICO|nr:adenylate kinase [Microbacterium keratanolyticum]MBM7469453.1 adenylate kinase [Microbacterium keratanolyticum]GLK01533.1 adenylate kinase [Microbacterium keratanolyticum]